MTPAWVSRIRKGDVLRSGSGVLRVVREVSHSEIRYSGPPHIRTSVYFAIKRCSWTRRCYTVYTGNDLIQMGYRPVRARVTLRKSIDRAIERDIQRPGYHKPKLTCCDVEGVA
jgi:hypothetical protein